MESDSQWVVKWVQDSIVEYVYDPACNRVNTGVNCGQQANQTCIGRLAPRFAAALNGSAPFPKDTLIEVIIPSQRRDLIMQIR